MDIKQIRETADRLFSKRSQFMTLCQEIAENFYPQRADFTLRREIGDEFSGDTMTSFPILCQRDLQDNVGTMLRPSGKLWHHMEPVDESRRTTEAKGWLEWGDGVMHRAMYDRVTHFHRATKEADGDYSCFGQAVLSARLNKDNSALLYRCWHLRDVAWLEDENGDIVFVARKWKPQNRDLNRIFGGKNHSSIEGLARRDPFGETQCYHIVCVADMYEDNSKGKPYWSIYYDCDHSHLIEAVPTWNKEYIVPRWQTVSGSQYAFSPATIVALPDARLIQSMTYTLLEAGEKITNPPLVATQNAVRSDVAIYAGGVTWVSEEYDERLGSALRPIEQDYHGLPIGIDMMRDLREMLVRDFYLNKMTLPQPERDMTAFETGKRIEEYIRAALPIFEPMEAEYNGQLCEITFDLLMRGGALGSPRDMPDSLQGAEIQFRFESPLHDAIEARKAQSFIEMRDMVAAGLELDPSVSAIPDFKTALRDALLGARVPANWVNSLERVEEIVEAQEAAEQLQQGLAAAESGSQSAANIGKAEKDLSATGQSLESVMDAA